ncbi:MAG: 50S ribosomal protein L13 [Spirochaetota bacterium]|nr:50S ribosomal protein L13 [Spirochaetota bacterium]
MKTHVARKEDIVSDWIIIDAKNQVLGRLASKIAGILRGKNKANYSPHLPMGDGVIVINIEKMAVTGKKEKNKIYHHHSGYPGGVKSISYEKVILRKPDFPLKTAVKGMLPKNRLGRKLFLRLKVYEGENHPHIAQQPKKG